MENVQTITYLSYIEKLEPRSINSAIEIIGLNVQRIGKTLIGKTTPPWR